VTLTAVAGKIHPLPAEVVGRIAAGEVVERPASVVKELIENSLDAGASLVTIEIKDGGASVIRVTDDGEGMSRLDAPRAFERHATSKVRSDLDLWALRTMGFRGEALPSIAAVSRVTVVTATREEAVGTRLRLVEGRAESIEDAATTPGTKIEVGDLFYNTPARKKFLRAPTTEFGHISHTVQQASLAWPSVGFRLLHNGQEVFHHTAVSSERARLLQVYRAGFLDRAKGVRAEREGLSLTGFVIDPVHAKTSRAPQDLFVNRRPVRSPMLVHAVTEAYSQFVARGRYPTFVLFLEVDGARVDVNVHPTKREVRFLDQDQIHRFVQRAVRDVLSGSPQPASGAGTFSGTLHEATPHLRASLDQVVEAFRQGSAGGARAFQPHRPVDHAPASEQLSLGSQTEAGRVGEPSGVYTAGEGREVIPFGQVDRTFLLAQVGCELQIVDQHTAHERVLFQRLWRAWQQRAIQVQPLLLPETLDLPDHQASLLSRSLGDLERIGVVIEPFGTATFLIRATPAALGTPDLRGFVEDLLDDLTQWDSLSVFDERVKKVLSTLACHGAVRSGRGMALPEIKQLVGDWVEEGSIMTCPHGRRVALRFPAEDLARLFGRA
jgi:DNA mismatch repair protein MutL